MREYRNDLIERLSDSAYLRTYLLDEFHLSDLSMVKLDFIMRALAELKSSRIDLSHYARLILETRKKGSLTISKQTEKYFRTDIERTIRNYV